MNLPVQYFIINSGVNMTEPKPDKKKILKTIHNAGFFSCATIRLLDIIAFYKEHGVPDEVESSEQFLHYKRYPGQNLIPFFYSEQHEKDQSIPDGHEVSIIMDCMAVQFDSYKNIDFDGLSPFVYKYFYPSDAVLGFQNEFIDKYDLNNKNLCAVFYRGNDKHREMKLPSYEAFIDKAKEIKILNPDVTFLVQPDEREFLNAFIQAFPDSIYIEETPMLNKSDTSMFYELESADRADYGARFFAAVLCLSACDHVITHSGNGALWLALYRGDAENVHQIFNDEWI